MAYRLGTLGGLRLAMAAALAACGGATLGPGTDGGSGDARETTTLDAAPELDAGTGSSASSSGLGGSSTSGSASGGSTGSSTSSGSIVGNAVCQPGPLLIDDMTTLRLDGNGVNGFWTTYSDRMNPYSEPPVLASGPVPGTIRPPEGAFFLPTPGLAVPPGLPGGRECSGGGEANWGCGFGFDLIDAIPDGGNVIPFWVCPDAGPAYFSDQSDAGTVIPLPFDASPHAGVSFWAISLNGQPQPVEVLFGEKRTSPWGGVCNACATRTYLPDQQCGDDYLELVSIPTSWTEFTIHWNQLKTANFSKQNLPPQGFDPTTWYSMHFQLRASPAKPPLPPFDLAVACVQFVDK
jgi:hypothetical protein